MPGGDRTGPLGRGPLSGRGCGPCRSVGPRNYGYDCGYGYGPGYTRGYGRRFTSRRGGYYPYEEVALEDREILELQKKELQARIKFIDKQLEELSEEEE